MLALLAGSGRLPLHVITACERQNLPFLVIGFEGQTDRNLYKDYRHVWVPLGAIGQILEIMHREGVKQIVMAGSIHRPRFSEISLDRVGLTWAARLGLKFFQDDGLLSAVVKLLEEEGFEVVSAADIVQELLCPMGVLTTAQPEDKDWQDITRGMEVLKALGQVDVGQAVIVQEGLVLGIEAVEGTQGLIERTISLRKNPEGGVLVKMAKSAQNMKVDLPTIGPDTIDQVHAAGLRGIALQAGVTQILDQPQVVDKANSFGLFLVGFESS